MTTYKKLFEQNLEKYIYYSEKLKNAKQDYSKEYYKKQLNKYQSKIIKIANAINVVDKTIKDLVNKQLENTRI